MPVVQHSPAAIYTEVKVCFLLFVLVVIFRLNGTHREMFTLLVANQISI